VKSARHVAAGKARAATLTPEHQAAAGRAGYRRVVEKLYRENIRPDGTLNAERFAERLSCFRLNHGFRKSRGLTSEYVIGLARELNPERDPLTGRAVWPVIWARELAAHPAS